MKLKCDDGKIRTCTCKGYGEIKIYKGCLIDSKCLSCGANFGVHDTHLLKPKWKKHICNSPKLPSQFTDKGLL